METENQDFPGGVVDGNPPVSAGDMRSIPSPRGSESRRIPRAVEQWSLYAATTEPTLSGLCSAREATAMRSPCTATREEPPLSAAWESPSTTKARHIQK